MAETRPNIDQRSRLGGLEWRIAHSLLETHLALARAYAVRGSAREAAYFSEQAVDLARVLGAPALPVRALLRSGEVALSLGRVAEVEGVLEEVDAVLERERRNMPSGSGLTLSREQAEFYRLRGDYLLRSGKEEEAFQAYQEARQALEIARKEVMLSVQKLGTDGPSDDSQDVFLPVLHAIILKQQGKTKWLI